MGSGSTKPTPKSAPTVIAAAAVNQVESKKKDVPNGYAQLFSGVRIVNNQYTCPVLAIHTWSQSAKNVRTTHGVLNMNETTRGGRRGSKATLLTQAGQRREMKMDLDEDIQIIPIEDILKIDVSTIVRKGIEENKVARVKTPPPENLSCGERCWRSCCCCCAEEPRVAPEQVVTTTERRDARRTISVTIEHLRYSLVDTPSTINVLDKPEQQAFYGRHKGVDNITFYYLDNQEFDEAIYRKQLQEVETLARLVMQLKAMKGHYPDPQQLKEIIIQREMYTYGATPLEHVSLIRGATDTTVATSMILPPS